MEPESDRSPGAASPWEPPTDGDASPHRDPRETAVRLVYAQALYAPAASVLVALLLCLGLREVVDTERLAVFLLLVGGSAVLRTGIVLVFRRRGEIADLGFWARLFDGTLIVACLAWGLGALYVRPAESPLHQLVIFFFLLGMAGASNVVYAGARVGAIGGAVAFLVPTIVVFALEPSLAFRVSAAGGVVFLLLTSRGILAFSRFMARSFELTQALEGARHEAEVLARTDDLTGLLNRRAFYEMGQYLVEQASRHHRPLSILVLDIDRFKDVNDRYGHAAGDATLRAVARIVEQSGRRIDVVGRLGGDELAMLLPDTAAADALSIAERIRDTLSALRIHEEGEEISLTCSLGVAGGPVEGNLDDLVRRADVALYQAKEQGRDQVVG